MARLDRLPAQIRRVQQDTQRNSMRGDPWIIVSTILKDYCLALLHYAVGGNGV